MSFLVAFGSRTIDVKGIWFNKGFGFFVNEHVHGGGILAFKG